MSAKEEEPPPRGGSCNILCSKISTGQYEEEEVGIPKVEYYEPSGGKNVGMAYQLSLVTFYLLKVLTTLDSFDLATEATLGGKFDDVVLRSRKKDGYLYHHLAQVKHRSKSITSDALITKKFNGDMSLRVYFESYLNFRARFKDQGDEIGSLLMCTNARFRMSSCLGHGDLKNALEPTETEDFIFGKKLLKFKKSFTGRECFEEHFKKLEGYCYKQEDFEEFFEKLTFATGIEDLDNLEKLNREMFANMTGILNDSGDGYKVFKHDLEEWAYGKEAYYLSHVEAKNRISALVYRYGGMSFDLIDPVGNFAGRKSELEAIERAWEDGTNNTVVINGLSGMGKTQLARKYIADHRERFKWAANVTAAKAKTVFATLAKTIGLKPEGKDEKEIAELVYRYCNPRQSVFLFENAENMSRKDLETYLPNGSPRPFIIVTTREPWNWKNDHKLHLKELTSCEAEFFLRDNLPYETHMCGNGSVEDLAVKMQNVPVALQQSVRYINDRHEKCANFGEIYSVGDFLESLYKVEEETCNILSMVLSGTNRIEYGCNLVEAWIETMEKIRKTERGDIAIDILKLISYFNAKNIKVDDVTIFFGARQGEIVKDQLVLLKQFYVIELVDNLISINGLFQTIVRSKLRISGEVDGLMEWFLQFADRIETRHISSLLVHSIKGCKKDYTYKLMQILEMRFLASDFSATRSIN